MEKSPFCTDELEIFVIFCQFSRNLLCFLGIKIKLLWQWIIILLLEWYVSLMLVVIQWVSWHIPILRQNIIKFMIFKKYSGIAYLVHQGKIPICFKQNYSSNNLDQFWHAAVKIETIKLNFGSALALETFLLARNLPPKGLTPLSRYLKLNKPPPPPQI